MIYTIGLHPHELGNRTPVSPEGTITNKVNRKELKRYLDYINGPSDEMRARAVEWLGKNAEALAKYS